MSGEEDSRRHHADPSALTLPPGLHFGAVVIALKDMVESATAALLLFFSPSQNSMAIITVGPAQPTLEDGFYACLCVCVYVCVCVCGWTCRLLVSSGLPTNHFTVP